MRFLIILTIMAHGLLVNATQFLDISDDLTHKGKTLSRTLRHTMSTKVETLNDQGAEYNAISPITQVFIDLVASDPTAAVVEVGGAYGSVAKKCLEKGAKNYTLNDLSADHLAVFAYQMQQEKRKSKLACVRLLQGDFVTDKNIPPGSVKYASMTLVLHFLRPDNFEAGITKLSEIMAIDGVVCITTLNIECPWYQGRVFGRGVKAMFLERRSGKATQNFTGTIVRDDLPGIFCDDANQYHSFTTRFLQWVMRMQKTNGQLFFADQNELTKYFEGKGFKVESIENYGLPFRGRPWTHGGKDVIGFKLRRVATI